MQEGPITRTFSTAERCTLLKFKYTTLIRCPCLLAGRPCISACKCINCENPKGVRPKHLPNRPGERRSHAWSLKPVNSFSYADKEQESISTGPRTQLEYLLLLHQNDIELDVSIYQKLYHTCLDIMQSINPSPPILLKRPVNEYDQTPQSL